MSDNPIVDGLVIKPYGGYDDQRMIELRIGEIVVVGGVRIEILGVQGKSRVKLGIHAPRDIRVDRPERRRS